METEFLNKEEMIKRYILNVDFSNDEWNVNKIREDLKLLLKEEPGIDVAYSKDPLLNEETGKVEKIEKLEQISIIFTDLNDKFKKLDFNINL